MAFLLDRLKALFVRRERTPLNWHEFDQTQFEGVAEDARKRQIIIGLDFGTSFTKVVIGSAADRFAVSFKDLVESSNPHLLPSALSQVGHDWLPGRVAGVEDVVSGLKLRLLNHDFSVESRARCALFLALTLRYARAWFFREQQALFGNSIIVWLLNLGVPAASYHNTTLGDVYKDLAKLAWDLSVLPGRLTHERVERYVRKGSFSPSTLPQAYRSKLLPRGRIQIIPEFVAQLAAYVRSQQYAEGLHALVDVGGGTLDFAVFNIGTPKGDFRFATFAKDVRSLGTSFLVEHRCASVTPPSQWRPGEFDDFPKDDVFATKLHCRVHELIEIDRQLLEQIPTMIAKGLSETRTKKGYGNPETWQNGVPLFLCGGGARIDAYRRNIFPNGTDRRLSIYQRQLPMPDRFRVERGSERDYDRLSVAYGLSYTAEDIGEIFRTDEIPPLVLEGDEVQSASASAPSATCPRCRGTGGLLASTPCPNCGGTGWIS